MYVAGGRDRCVSRLFYLLVRSLLSAPKSTLRELDSSSSPSFAEFLDECEKRCIDAGACDSTCSLSNLKQTVCAEACAYQRCDLPMRAVDREVVLNELAKRQFDHCLYVDIFDLIDGDNFFGELSDFVGSFSMSMDTSAKTSAQSATTSSVETDPTTQIEDCFDIVEPFCKDKCAEGNSAKVQCAKNAAVERCEIPEAEDDRVKFLKTLGLKAKQKCLEDEGLSG